MNSSTVLVIGLSILVIILFLSTIKIISQRSVFIVERLGKYNSTLLAGLNILIPFFDKVRYKHILKEQAIDVAS